MLTDPNYVSLKWDSLHVNDNLNAEKSNYATDITLSTGLVNKLILSHSNSYSDVSYNPNNDERQIKINNYYISKYEAETNVLKQIIFFCGLCIIGCLFYIKGIISEGIYILYLGIIIAVGSIYVCSSIIKLYFRDRIYYDEYDYGLMYDPGKGIDLSYNTYRPEIDVSSVKKVKDSICV
jgi:hypothetical protein